MFKNIFKKLSKLHTISNNKRSYTNRNLIKLLDRGFFQDFFPDVAGPQMQKLFESGSQTIYAGFDPSADSLHIGNLLVITGLLHCQRAGHNPIAVLGGATALIGDPSGRKTERQQMHELTIQKNLVAIEQQLQRIFQNHADCLWADKNQQTLKPLRILNNIDWYKQLNLIDFMANMGRHFRLGSMLSRTSVKTRLESEEGMSFTEFTYQVFQAYDWLHLLRSYDCRFQLGGSDQMGNIMSGHELISRTERKIEVFGLTLPLVTNEEGDKFGKTGGTAVWLDAEKTSPFSLYQYFIRRTDDEVEKLLKLFTFLPLNDIEKLMKTHSDEPEKRKAQTILAEDVTLLVHGENGLQQAERISQALYKGNLEGLAALNYKEIKQTLDGATLVELLAEPEMNMLQLAMKAKCFPSEADAIRIITAGGFYVNQKRCQNVGEVLTYGVHMLKNGLTLVRVGKRNFYIIRWLK